MLARKLKALALAAAVALPLSLGAPSAFAAGGQMAGDGTEATPYRIEDAADLAAFRDLVNAGAAPGEALHAELAADIDLGGGEWEPIGFNGSSYAGSFEGNGRTVSNFRISQPGAYSVGLFGEVGAARISGLGVERAEVVGGRQVGAIAGQMSASGSSDGLYGCWTEGCTVSGENMVGGIVGRFQGSLAGEIRGCRNASTVASEDGQAGGVVGKMYSARVIDCQNDGAVTATGEGADMVGGVIGWAVVNSPADLDGLCNTGSVGAPGGTNVGGIAGLGMEWASNVYNTGAVTGRDHVGGIVGSEAQNLTNAFNLGPVTGGEHTGSIAGSWPHLGETIANVFYLTGTADAGFGGADCPPDIAALTVREDAAAFEDPAGVLAGLAASDPRAWNALLGDAGTRGGNPWLHPALHYQSGIAPVLVRVVNPEGGTVTSPNRQGFVEGEVADGDSLYAPADGSGSLAVTAREGYSAEVAYSLEGGLGQASSDVYAFTPGTSTDTVLTVTFTKQEGPRQPEQPAESEGAEDPGHRRARRRKLPQTGDASPLLAGAAAAAGVILPSIAAVRRRRR